MKFWVIISVGAFYLGSCQAYIAPRMGTCTMGSADHLEVGVLASGCCYLIALVAMKLSVRERTIMIAILPVLLVLLWQLVFSFQLAVALIWQELSACAFLHGLPYQHSSNETFLAVAWPVMTISVVIGLAIVWNSRYPKS